jgi:hypothetical protein
MSQLSSVLPRFSGWGAKWRSAALVQILLTSSCACAEVNDGDHPLLARNSTSLRLGERVPNVAEAVAVGAPGTLTRGTRQFGRLVRCSDPRIVFKDEEKTEADRMMTPRLRAKLSHLAELVQRSWPGIQLRVTEAWDENREHGSTSVHYEGRAADVTTSDMDPEKLGELARLAVQSEFDWVFFENVSHVHVSVRK